MLIGEPRVTERLHLKSKVDSSWAYPHMHSIFWCDNLFLGILFLLIHFPFLSHQQDIMPLASESSESCAVELSVSEPGRAASADTATAESSCSEGRSVGLNTESP